MSVPAVGDVVAGKYRVERVLGRGGMGIVVEAVHTSLKQRVAIKLLLPAALEAPGAVTRFLHEAQAAAALRSEHVARVMDVGTLGSGLPYLVMEHLSGTDLQALIEGRGALSVATAIDHLLQACEAVAEAHALGIVHRDLKPSNLFLTVSASGAPLVKVLDFGISRMLDSEEIEAVQPRLTITGVVLGSPCYMSPEQVRSVKNVDARADLWALGVCLYQMLTARLPFEGPTMSALFATIAADAPIGLRARRPELPEELEVIVLQCLEKDVARRVQSVAELAEALEPFGSERSRGAAERVAWILKGSAGRARGGSGDEGHAGATREGETLAFDATEVTPPPRRRMAGDQGDGTANGAAKRTAEGTANGAAKRTTGGASADRDRGAGTVAAEALLQASSARREGSGSTVVSGEAPVDEEHRSLAASMREVQPRSARPWGRFVAGGAVLIGMAGLALWTLGRTPVPAAEGTGVAQHGTSTAGAPSPAGQPEGVRAGSEASTGAFQESAAPEGQLPGAAPSSTTLPAAAGQGDATALPGAAGQDSAAAPSAAAPGAGAASHAPTPRHAAPGGDGTQRATPAAPAPSSRAAPGASASASATSPRLRERR
ncbi:serine/threonine protein kinase [Chondromyces apiculatus]|uniref:Serine/threonine-protein kinase pkn3 n=1 Tax=Chondromyces apiculatus DSM 436 TaxID=1192034 RepID=A0A017TE99_9BACT|nr:serine/threonine-protein kinase [Chondromyces apiculatus]EYF07539.1 Serine/threonine-protein kinase pkn3 [Chondromyces apiculatus DSM 436]